MQRPKVYGFEGVWADNFGHPPVGSKWMIWGESAGGKSTFVMQLAKYLTKFGRVDYYPDEEGMNSESLQRRLQMCKMETEDRFKVCAAEGYKEILEDMKRRRSADVYIFDSWQTMGFTYTQFMDLKRFFPGKTMIWVSRSLRDEPMGNSAIKAKFDCDLKVFVKGYAATCLGRFQPAAGSQYIIWQEGYNNRLNR